MAHRLCGQLVSAADHDAASRDDNRGDNGPADSSCRANHSRADNSCSANNSSADHCGTHHPGAGDNDHDREDGADDGFDRLHPVDRLLSPGTRCVTRMVAGTGAPGHEMSSCQRNARRTDRACR